MSFKKSGNVGWWTSAALACGLILGAQGGLVRSAGAQTTGPSAVELPGTHTEITTPTEKSVERAAQGAPTAAIAEASKEGSGPVQLEVAPKTGEFILTILIFVGLALVLAKFAWKPILQGLQAREAAIRDGVEAAARARAEAERTTKELEARIAEAQRQGAQALAQAKVDAVKLADSIKAQAEAESTAMKDRALRDIDAAKQQAVAEINVHAADLGTAIARKILQRNVTVDDQQKLVDEALGQMAARNN